ncbi:MAG: flagellar biosynthetic protein FliO [Dongiaceae bacterium]
MEWMELFRAVLALVLVLGLIAGAAWAARRFGPAMWFAAKPKGRRSLGVVESLPLDARHRLVLVRRDDRRHLLLIGPGQSLIVEDSIAEPLPGPAPTP